jgi:tetratricopeptide (TPR) repeat protein
MPMPSAFPTARIEPRRARRDAGAVRLRCCVVFLLAACASGPARPTADAPAVPLVASWPEGTRFRAVLAANVPDERTNRAAGIWWREALRQSVAFELLDGPGNGRGDGPALELSIDLATKTLAATWRDGADERVLAGGRYAGDELPAAIDRLAWSARLALGEHCDPPVPIANGTSATPAVVLDVDDATALLRDGGFQAARRILKQARTRDGGSPFVLDGLASLELLAGNLEAAERTAREGLAYEARVLPTTQHRLARTLLLARASRDPDHAAERDRDLRTLADVAARERPHDPEPRLSKALACNFLGEFHAARELLEQLDTQLPEQPIVSYHLGWACLGSGDAAAAVPHFERAAARLPAGWVLLPRAIALFESGQQGALRELLASLRGGDAADDRPLAIDVLRMQAAHALLTGDRAQARTFLLATLTWLLKHPQVLAQRSGELAEQGALLVRLGAGEELPPLLNAMQQQHAGGDIAEACTYVQALADVHRTHERLERVETTLAHGGDSPWASLLAAYAHEVRGEVADMQSALARAARLAGSPMTKTLLARGLRSAGKTAEADALLGALRREMKAINLRAPCRHPLLGPELAFAFVDA